MNREQLEELRVKPLSASSAYSYMLFLAGICLQHYMFFFTVRCAFLSSSSLNFKLSLMGAKNGSFLDESWSDMVDLIGNRRFD